MKLLFIALLGLILVDLADLDDVSHSVVGVYNEMTTRRCSGTLITTQHVLTAAQCVTSFAITPTPINSKYINVFYGSSNLDGKGTLTKAKNVKIPPVFCKQGCCLYYADIAVITLKSAVEGDYATTAPRYSAMSLSEVKELIKKQGKIYGWGKPPANNGEYYSELQSKDVAMITGKDCFGWMDHVNTNIQICSNASLYRDHSIDNTGAALFYDDKVLAVMSYNKMIKSINEVQTLTDTYPIVFNRVDHEMIADFIDNVLSQQSTSKN